MSKSSSAKQIELNPCPCCGGMPAVSVSSTTKEVIITCSKKGCKIVESSNEQDAANIWNEPRFSQAKEAV